MLDEHRFATIFGVVISMAVLASAAHIAFPRRRVPRDSRSREVNLAGEHRTEPVHQSRTVSWQISMPRSNSRSSTLCSDSG
jgi:hypothetical protein